MTNLFKHYEHLLHQPVTTEKMVHYKDITRDNLKPLVTMEHPGEPEWLFDVYAVYLEPKDPDTKYYRVLGRFQPTTTTGKKQMITWDVRFTWRYDELKRYDLIQYIT